MKIIRIFCFLLFLLFAILMLYFVSSNSVIRSVKSEKELLNINDNESVYSYRNKMLLGIPFSILFHDYGYKSWDGDIVFNESKIYDNIDVIAKGDSDSKDYSRTNIQIESVDEADIVKTDGNYIYSISENKVIITNVEDSSNMRIVSIIDDIDIPNDLIIYNDFLVVIAANEDVSYYNANTVVKIYNIKDKNKPVLTKSFELYQPYYTSRCIDGRLYVFSSGHLIEEDNHILRSYKEDMLDKEIKLHDIKYIKDNISESETFIAEIDLNNLKKKLKLSTYLIDISNAYISFDNIYLLDTNYDYDSYFSLKKLFGFKGIIGFFEDIDDYSFSEKTKIYKFSIDKNKGVVFDSNTKVNGSIINQYSLDEKDGNLRIALEDNNGTRIEILDKNLKLLGKTESVAKGEVMHSSRFIGDRAYLVTYRNTDPLFAVDLSNVVNPKVIGELKVPGYSDYLHPYDDNHLIGIGMETEENISRDIDGRVISNNVIVTGIKMSLFDVSDINNPKQLSKTTIGNGNTISAILTNPKALLFSKEKNLIAIPIINADQDVFVDEVIDDYISNSKFYISEGYYVYNIDLDSGFKLRGAIKHEEDDSSYDYRYQYQSGLLRGLYIDDNLYTVSQSQIKVNALKDLREISYLNLKEGDN